MSACDSCPKPGHCCKVMRLSSKDGPMAFWIATAVTDAQACMDTYGLPFKLIPEPVAIWKTEDGVDYGNFSFTCPKLGADGRCTIYEQRPQLCRDYQPYQDELCIRFGEERPS